MLSQAFAYADGEFDVVLNAVRKQTKGAFVSADAFRTLGVEPAAGRMLGPGDQRAGSADPVVVISYPLWERAFAADPAAIGRAF